MDVRRTVLLVAAASTLLTSVSSAFAPVQAGRQTIHSHPTLVAAAQKVADVCQGKLVHVSEYRSKNYKFRHAARTGPRADPHVSRHGQLKDGYAQAFDWNVEGGHCSYADQVKLAQKFCVEEAGLSMVAYGRPSLGEAGSHIHCGWDHGGGRIINARMWLNRGKLSQMLAHQADVLANGLKSLASLTAPSKPQTAMMLGAPVQDTQPPAHEDNNTHPVRLAAMLSMGTSLQGYLEAGQSQIMTASVTPRSKSNKPRHAHPRKFASLHLRAELTPGELISQQFSR